VWTDGARHAVIAARSGSGRRIVIEDEGDGMIKTNTLSVSGFWLAPALSSGVS
jgi:hypothetical protein